jgi:hypothetical protein
VPELNLVEVAEQLVVEELKPIPVTEAGVLAEQGELTLFGERRYAEERATALLTVEEVDHGLDGLGLKPEVGLEVELHRVLLTGS